MDVVVIGASERLEKAIVQEALKRKHEVTAAVRSTETVMLEHERLKVVQVDALDAASVAAAVAGHGEIISAYGPDPGREDDLLRAADSLIGGLRQSGVERLIIVGGAGSLKTESGEWLMDTADFPEEPARWRQPMRTRMRFTEAHRWIIPISALRPPSLPAAGPACSGSASTG